MTLDCCQALICNGAVLARIESRYQAMVVETLDLPRADSHPTQRFPHSWWNAATQFRRRRATLDDGLSAALQVEISIFDLAAHQQALEILADQNPAIERVVQIEAQLAHLVDATQKVVALLGSPIQALEDRDAPDRFFPFPIRAIQATAKADAALSVLEIAVSRYEEVRTSLEPLVTEAVPGEQQPQDLVPRWPLIFDLAFDHFHSQRWFKDVSGRSAAADLRRTHRLATGTLETIHFCLGHVQENLRSLADEERTHQTALHSQPHSE